MALEQNDEKWFGHPHLRLQHQSYYLVSFRDTKRGIIDALCVEFEPAEQQDVFAVPMYSQEAQHLKVVLSTNLVCSGFAVAIVKGSAFVAVETDEKASFGDVGFSLVWKAEPLSEFIIYEVKEWGAFGEIVPKFVVSRGHQKIYVARFHEAYKPSVELLMQLFFHAFESDHKTLPYDNKSLKLTSKLVSSELLENGNLIVKWQQFVLYEGVEFEIVNSIARCSVKADGSLRFSSSLVSPKSSVHVPRDAKITVETVFPVRALSRSKGLLLEFHRHEDMCEDVGSVFRFTDETLAEVEDVPFTLHLDTKDIDNDIIAYY